MYTRPDAESGSANQSAEDLGRLGSGRQISNEKSASRLESQQVDARSHERLSFLIRPEAGFPGYAVCLPSPKRAGQHRNLSEQFRLGICIGSSVLLFR